MVEYNEIISAFQQLIQLFTNFRKPKDSSPILPLYINEDDEDIAIVSS